MRALARLFAVACTSACFMPVAPQAMVETESSSTSTAAGPGAPSSEDGTSVPATDGTSGDETSATGGAMVTTGSHDGSSSASEGPDIFDFGVVPDMPTVEMGCQGVDLLFVIDNSGSMGLQQPKVLAAAPDFIGAIRDDLEEVTSYHVGVITSDAFTANEPGCMMLGDLVTQTQAHGECGPFTDGGRFATEADDLDAAIVCMADVGTFGSPIEQPVTASIAAVSEANAAAGACNEGFLRESAILVLVIVTDDPPYEPDFDDAHPDADTSGWYQAIIDAKGGDPEGVVVVGFIPWLDTSCVPLNLESPNLISFVDSFGDQGTKASICEPDFGPVLAATVDTIQSTCTNFVWGD